MRNAVLFMFIFSLSLAGCSKTQAPVEELRQYPLDSLEGVITRSGVEIDKDDSFDGSGSLRFTAPEPTGIRKTSLRLWGAIFCDSEKSE